MTARPPEPCEGAECAAKAETARWLCVTCDCTYCDLCWDRQGPHRRGKLGHNGLPHEKTSKDLHLRLKSIFEPPEKRSELLKLHLEDEDTLWFGVDKAANGKCHFTDTGRYSTLMTMTKQPTPTERYPLLVSFVGQTGAGKSTLIKMLVSLKELNMTKTMDDLFKTPVSGSFKDDRSPTSGDVHLYIDPQSAFSDLPMLYADCEGLEGGEVPPQSKTLLSSIKPKNIKSDQFTSREMNLPADKALKTGTREWAVRNVYPRLLYTFSDVIVFVLKNTRTFESVALRLLLEWASCSMESSLNQPALPQALIVLNASDPALDEGEWDVQTATERLMQHVKLAIWSDPIKKYMDKWSKKGTTIRSCEQLIRCYYSNVRVVRIPNKGRNMLVKDQVDKLYLELQQACQASFKAKWEARQYCTIDELNRYLQAAFDHFITKPSEPFNFIDAALKADPIPQGFSDHIMKLAYSACKKTNIGHAIEGPETFRKLSIVVASCIMLDCIRYKRPGKPQDLFDQLYANSCSTAAERFKNLWLQCSFVGDTGRKCVNSKLSHGKGHQKASGKIIAFGPFKDPPGLGEFGSEWSNMTREHFVRIEASAQEARTEAGSQSRTREKVAYELHRQHLMGFFENFEDHIPGRYTCYGCLMEVPQHPLPCGHMLCTSCVRMLGRPTDKNTVTVDFCPFDSKSVRKVNPCSIRFKPDFAGIRILSLDGGGMRGIVELESLRAIEKVLGKGLPIQAFFDLIVGTSTGGVIALGLGVKQWTVDQCITRFVLLCNNAFTPNELVNVKYLGVLSRTLWRSKYNTKKLHDTLKNNFGDEQLYGRVPEDTVLRDTKVCVITTSETAESAIAIGNYTRQSEDEHWYKFMRGDSMQVWEAASATTAAPNYFRKFQHRDSSGHFTEYYDGALYFNNPVRIAFNERRFLWPDMADRPPDIVLSLGTGKNGSLIDKAVEKEMPFKVTEESRTWCLPNSKFAKLRKSLASGARREKEDGFVKKVLKTLANMLDSILDAEREFKLFEADHAQPQGSNRYLRLNPDLRKEPPALDETSQMLSLQEQVQKLFKTPEYELTAERIAFRLVASSFYFTKVPSIQYDDGARIYTCRGRLACRFEGNSNDMTNALRSLGHFFRRQSTTNFRPFFTIKESANDVDDHKIEIDRGTIDDMIDVANFHVAEEVEITVPDRLSSINIFLCLTPSHVSEPELFPISGFPRSLITEDASTASLLQKRAEIIKLKIKKSEMLVGNSLLDFLQGDTTDEGAISDTVNANTNEDDGDEKNKEDVKTLLDRSSTSTSRTSKDDKDLARSNDTIKPRPTDFRTSRSSPKTSPSRSRAGLGSSNLVTVKSTDRVISSSHTSKSNLLLSKSRKKGSQGIQEDLDKDDEALVNALRPPASSEGAEIIDAADFMPDQRGGNEYEGESDGSIKEIRKERGTMSADEEEEESDSDGDFDA